MGAAGGGRPSPAPPPHAPQQPAARQPPPPRRPPPRPVPPRDPAELRERVQLVVRHVAHKVAPTPAAMPPERLVDEDRHAAQHGTLVVWTNSSCAWRGASTSPPGRPPRCPTSGSMRCSPTT